MLSPNFNPFPELNTERLVLRRITPNDAGDFFILRSDKNIMQHIGRPLAISVNDAIELINVIEDLLLNNNGITWGITLKNKNTLAGTIGLWKLIKEHYRAEIGYLLHPELQGKGIMQEAMAAVLDYGFKNIGIHSVEAKVSPENRASIKLLERNNFIREAYFKENYYHNGEFLDTYIYSLLTPFKK